MPPARGDAEEVIGGGIDVVDADLGFFAGSDTRLCHGYSPQYALLTDTNVIRAQSLCWARESGVARRMIFNQREASVSRRAQPEIYKGTRAPLFFVELSPPASVTG
jgi:hypothetical protein